MKQPDKLPEIGTKLKTHDKLESENGLMVHPRHLANRKTSTECVYLGHVPGHGGDVWWCEHEAGKVAAYSFTEVEFV
jgi:hypothetical protein